MPLPSASEGASGVAAAPHRSPAPSPSVESLPFVEAPVTHVVRGPDKPVVRTAALTGGAPERLAAYTAFDVRIRDLRPVADRFSLDREGFALVRHDTSVRDFRDDDEVRRVYYPEIQALLRDAAGAAEVVVFDHTLRVDDGTGDSGNGLRAPVRLVHNDYTEKSGPQRVRDLLPSDEAERWLAGRFAVINVWRPVRGPVETAPLALADATSMQPGDFVAADLVYPDRVGEIYDVAHDPRHRWYYVPRMERHEALLLKCYDSALDGTARFTAHTAFDDPTTPAGAAPRESIEIRTLVRFPDAVH